MASTDASAYPIKNAAWRVTFPILDADGDLVTGATGLDSEVSKDGGTFADCTNEATEIATNSGVYYLDLTSTEMNADTVAIIVKTSSSGAKTTTIVAYPITTSTAKLGVNVVNIAGSAVNTSSAQLGVNVVNAAGTAWGSGAITAASIASDAITAAKLASDVTTELQNGLATASALSTVAGYLDTEIAAILEDTGTTLPGTLATIASYIDTEIATLQTSVDDLPTNSELATALAAADDAVLDAIAALNDPSAADVAAAYLAATYEGSETVQDHMRLTRAALVGKVSGAATTTATFRDLADAKDRITATVDADGNRTAVTVDAS